MSQSVPVGDPQGPDTITIYSHEKIDGSFIKFKDNQQKTWNCALTEKTADLIGFGLGATVQVIWQLMEGTLGDGTKYQSKYINDVRRAPEGTPAQELREPYTGGGGGGGSRGGGGGGKSDYRSKDEMFACEALQAASRFTADRKACMEAADVLFLWLKEKGKQSEHAPEAAPSTGPSFDAPAAAPAAPAGPSFADGAHAATEATFKGDDDIPF